MRKILVWFRNDLRVRDHEPLCKAVGKAEVIPYYCFDVRQFLNTSYSFPKTGAFRTKFLLESVRSLGEEISKRGGRLLVETGKPEERIPQLVATLGIDAVYAHKEVTDEEIQVEEALEYALWRHKVPTEYFWGTTLYHLEDLPFPVKNLPEVFSDFRKEVERYVNVRELLPAPLKINVPAVMPPGRMPTLEGLGLAEPVADERAVLAFRGGEPEALARMQTYCWDRDALQHYKYTRNGLIGADYSSKLAPWLSTGCISPRTVFWEVKRYERERLRNESTQHLITELMWRDFFRFIAKKHANKIFKAGGIKEAPVRFSGNPAHFERWRTGTTGCPFIDANLTEMMRTGYMSSRGRQNVASFLVKDLALNWVPGAAWFESQLLDYDPASNWGNWNYVAGVGNDPREGRHFNVVKQAREYDPEGEYVKRWLPQLRDLPPALVHTPWLLTVGQRGQYGLTEEAYPFPIVEPRGTTLARN
jgi:deoxyribodipyrimidine photo-lyase